MMHSHLGANRYTYAAGPTPTLPLKVCGSPGG
jgi:hypothetical protein